MTVVMSSYYENVCSCKRHTVVRRARFVFGDRFALSWPRDSYIAENEVKSPIDLAPTILIN